MVNFDYYSPTRLIFGKGVVEQLAEVMKPIGKRVLLTYGGGSIKNNGVYAQIIEALEGYNYIEFGGIEPNPSIETLNKAVKIRGITDKSR